MSNVCAIGSQKRFTELYPQLCVALNVAVNDKLVIKLKLLSFSSIYAAVISPDLRKKKEKNYLRFVSFVINKCLTFFPTNPSFLSWPVFASAADDSFIDI